MRLVLASASPRRQSLLSEAGYDFLVDPADIDESATPADQPPTAIACLLAQAKAQAVAVRHPDAVVLGADTVVAVGPVILGKPTDRADARRILCTLSGTTHQVITGVCLIRGSDRWQRIAHAASTVQMKTISNAELEAYLDSGQWQGKAGAYGIQDDDPFVLRMDGSHSNIVGLPMELTRELLAEAGVRPR